MAHLNARDVEPASDLSRRLGLSFSSLSLLVRALTHRSYVNEYPQAVEDNERLEFLGDAVLDFTVGAWVYNRFPELPEGDLTKMRSALVRNEQLAKFSRRLDLGRALRLGRGEASSGGHNRDNLLGSAFEALIGALYLDSGLGAVDAFVIPILEESRESILNEIHDPKSQLQEWTQSHKLDAPRYHVVSTSGPDHAVVFEMIVEVAGVERGRGTGTSKSHAEHAAAQDALNNLEVF
ncbi:MAG: ribonuclease III [Anaerolineales bacterium]|uniref:ribonuclease III n=1 Tax=Candidatus Villigracilis proximus TaxID=3140683 RepID=UPI003136B407|nr:ribonuclease III [Anaerolineales bacterium]